MCHGPFRGQGRGSNSGWGPNFGRHVWLRPSMCMSPMASCEDQRQRRGTSGPAETGTGAEFPAPSFEISSRPAPWTLARKKVEPRTWRRGTASPITESRLSRRLPSAPRGVNPVRGSPTAPSRLTANDAKHGQVRRVLGREPIFGVGSAPAVSRAAVDAAGAGCGPNQFGELNFASWISASRDILARIFHEDAWRTRNELNVIQAESDASPPHRTCCQRVRREPGVLCQCVGAGWHRIMASRRITPPVAGWRRRRRESKA